jgi:hypothetical protein
MDLHAGSGAEFLQKPPAINRTTGSSYTQNDAQLGGFSANFAFCWVGHVLKSTRLGQFCSEFRTECLRRQSPRQYNFMEVLEISRRDMAFGPSGRSDSAPQLSILGEAGQKLKRIRERLRLKFRDIEEASLKIAAARQNDEFVVALSRLADIENKGTIPSIYRLYSLCAIYRLDLCEVLSWYGVPADQLAGDASLVELPRTQLVGFSSSDQFEVQAPVALDPGIDLSKTEFLSRMIQRWGTLPLTLLKRVDLRNFRYGLVGTEDWFMYPIIAPGSLVVIDDSRRRIVNSGWNNEFDRPIYFLELRSGYACAWCSLRDDRMILQPHPASQCEPQVLAYPEDVEVIGQITEVAMSLDPAQRRRPRA